MSHDIIVNTIGTIVGGIILTGILFFLNEKILPPKNLSGEWQVSSTTLNSSYNPYKDLRLHFIFHLLQKGTELTGSGEKIKEIYKDGTSYEFERDKRIILNIEGYYRRNIFSADQVHLNIIEYGQRRQVRTMFILSVNNHTSLNGKFSSTAADSRGEIQMIKS